MKNSLKLVTVSTLLGLSLISVGTVASCAAIQKHETVGQYIDSSVLTTNVKAKILAEKALTGTSISVKSYKNTVQLSGKNRCRTNYI